VIHDVFFSGARPAPAPAAGYALAAHHLDDELRFAAAALARAAARSVDDGGGAIAAEAQVSELRQQIDARVAATAAADQVLPLRRIQVRLGLTDLERDMIALLVAVEVEPRLLAALATPGGVPPVALTAAALQRALTGPVVTAQLFVADLLHPVSVLSRGVVVRGDDGAPQLPLAAAPLRLNRGVLAAALGATARDPALAGLLADRSPGDAGRPSDADAHLAVALRRRGVALWLSGPLADGRELAGAVAAVAGRPLVEIDARALAGDGPRARQRAVEAIAIDQALRDWVGLVEVTGDDADELAPALRALADGVSGPLIVTTAGDAAAVARVASEAPRHHLARPTAAERRALWEAALERRAMALPARHVTELADAFPLSRGEIGDVVAAAVRADDGAAASLEGLRAACMVRQRARLDRLADFIPPAFGWDELVLGEEERERLREIAARIRHRHTVLTVWNFAKKLPYGSGTAALFAGPPGTGKTMAASVLSGVLRRELYRIDLSRVVDKYIGETEKNLGRIFDAAADSDAMLLFDEADSLFGKRTQVQSSNDRYANLETNYLLQRIEQHTGVSILTTNHVQHIDEAFARRIPFRVDFPFPDEHARAEIWRRCFPDEVPQAGLDFARLGATYPLSGGHIKSAVVRAAFMAAEAGGPVTPALIRRAVALEFEALGKLAPPG